MLKTLLLSASFAASLSLTAQAQTAPQSDDSAMKSDPSAASSDATTPSTAKPGMVVKDSAGDTLGEVTQVGQTDSGESAVVVNIDGQPFTLAANTLTPSGDGLVSSMTKAQIKSAPKAG